MKRELSKAIQLVPRSSAEVGQKQYWIKYWYMQGYGIQDLLYRNFNGKILNDRTMPTESKVAQAIHELDSFLEDFTSVDLLMPVLNRTGAFR